MVKSLTILVLLLLVACSNKSSDATVTSQLPDGQSVGAKVMKKYCASCHAPPLPSSHPADEWPNVVYRMEHHRLMKGLDGMSSTERESLLSYLENNAVK